MKQHILEHFIEAHEQAIEDHQKALKVYKDELDSLDYHPREVFRLAQRDNERPQYWEDLSSEEKDAWR